MMTKIKEMFGKFLAMRAGRPAIQLGAVKAIVSRLDSNLPYTLAFIAYRMPGTDSPDYAASQILADVLSSQRGICMPWCQRARRWVRSLEWPRRIRASVAFGLVAEPAGVDSLRDPGDARILENYAAKGVRGVGGCGKKSEVAAAEFQRNSIPAGERVVKRTSSRGAEVAG